MDSNIIKFEPQKEIHILVVDDNPVSRKLLEETLLSCNYQVTVTGNAKKALSLLRKGKKKFDIAMVDVHQSEAADAFDFIEMATNMKIYTIDIPAICDEVLLKEASIHGADNSMAKPVGLDTDEVAIFNTKDQYIKDEHGKADRSSEISYKFSSPKEKCDDDDEDKKVCTTNEDLSYKKRRISWKAGDLNDRFLKAIDTLGGIDSKYSTPKRIQELMNAGDEVKRTQISSHLQKQKEKANKGRTVKQQEGNLTNQNQLAKAIWKFKWKVELS